MYTTCIICSICFVAIMKIYDNANLVHIQKFFLFYSLKASLSSVRAAFNNVWKRDSRCTQRDKWSR